ncbi:MAG: septum formation initiator family protein [Candidatus Pacebacteria bacterium]|nr:septum formation initiator family protein [Candidatus Paceibacterota bacterium]
MREFQEKRTARRRLYSKTTAVILLILIVLVGRGTWNIYQKERESALAAARAKAELTQLQTRQADLSKKLTYIKTDAGVEEEIRQDFQVAKEGEQVFVIVDASTSEASSTGSGGWWGQIWHWGTSLFGKQGGNE